tara:strand:- start:5192 stop:5596 length:405 start_codon:yes stop_codon:yes gene_type:complete
MTEQVINSLQSLEAYKQHLDAQFEKHKYLRVDMKTGKQRSLTQNAALHLYCTHVSDMLNDGGKDFRAMIKQGVDVPWTPELVKDYMWRPIQKLVTGHDSSVKPERHQYGEIYDVLNRHLSDKHDLFIPWPSKDR